MTRASKPTDHRKADRSSKGGRVVVAGYGPVGRAVAEMLDEAGMKVTIVDLNPTTVRRQTTLGKPVIHGDISEERVLKQAGIDKADALILTVPDEQAALRACAAARRLAPDIFIAARTSFLSQGLLAAKAGADHVTVEELVTAEAMRHAVVRHLKHSHP